jgi:hypothetical protein
MRYKLSAEYFKEKYEAAEYFKEKYEAYVSMGFSYPIQLSLTYHIMPITLE